MNTLPEGYEVVKQKTWVLKKIAKRGPDKILYKCKAQSEAGAIRESLLFLEGKL